MSSTTICKLTLKNFSTFFLETKIYRELLQKVEMIKEKKATSYFSGKRKKVKFCMLIKSDSFAEYYGRSFGRVKTWYIHQWLFTKTVNKIKSNSETYGKVFVE